MLGEEPVEAPFLRHAQSTCGHAVLRAPGWAGNVGRDPLDGPQPGVTAGPLHGQRAKAAAAA